MAPPSAIQDLTSIGVTKSLTRNNHTAFANPGLPISADSPLAQLAPLDASLLQKTLTTHAKPFFTPSGTQFGDVDVCTDHMVSVRWTSTHGWAAPHLHPYRRLDLWPTASALHYATECFEGMKAFRGFDGKLRLFRPVRNAARMLVSASRIALPSFSPEELEKLIVKLVATEGAKWCPEPGTFVYIRPTLVGTGKTLGVVAPREACLFVIVSLFPRLFGKPMKLLGSREDEVRAWPGGWGYAKLGANYGPSLLAQREAETLGYSQILWLLGPSAQVTEAGASNFFCVLRSAHNPERLELTTAPLDDKIILDGVTRRSILELARDVLTHEMPHLEVVERNFTMPELLEAHEQGRLLEAFAAGTAYFVTAVAEVAWRREGGLRRMVLDVGEGESKGGNEGEKEGKEGSCGGPVTRRIRQLMSDIMYGGNHKWGVVVPETPFEDCRVDEQDVEALVGKIKMLKKNAAWEAAMERVRCEESGERCERG